jgi:uncharacterized membrane protein
MQQPSGSGSTGLTDNMASALCYLPIVALVFLFVAPYNANKTVRFHAFQSLFLTAAVIVVNIVLSTLAGSMYYVTGVGVLLALTSSLFGLAVLALYIVLAIRAYQGQGLELPFISQFARQQAGA